MVNDQCVIIHKASHKKGRRHDYDIHKKSHPATPEQAVSMFDLGCPWSGERLSRTKLIHAKQKETKHRIVSGKKITTKAILKKDGDRAYHLQDKEMQDSCRHV